MGSGGLLQTSTVLDKWLPLRGAPPFASRRARFHDLLPRASGQGYIHVCIYIYIHIYVYVYIMSITSYQLIKLY